MLNKDDDASFQYTYLPVRKYLHDEQQGRLLEAFLHNQIYEIWPDLFRKKTDSREGGGCFHAPSRALLSPLDLCQKETP